jgi:hypothetical protein
LAELAEVRPGVLEPATRTLAAALAPRHLATAG